MARARSKRLPVPARFLFSNKKYWVIVMILLVCAGLWGSATRTHPLEDPPGEHLKPVQEQTQTVAFPRQMLEVFNPVLRDYEVTKNLLDDRLWQVPLIKEDHDLEEEVLDVPSAPLSCDPNDLVDVCGWFNQSHAEVWNEERWGPYRQCDVADAKKMLACAAHQCKDCVTGEDTCLTRPMLLFHQLLFNLDSKDPHGNLRSMQSYLLTQDLTKTRLIVWTPNITAIYNQHTADFFNKFRRNVLIRHFNYSALVAGTPMERSPFFGNITRVLEYVPQRACQASLGRLLLLFHFGGVWQDNDLLFLRDMYPLMVQVGYQWISRPNNNHILYIRKQSPLALRLLHLVTLMPFDHPNFVDQVINGLCKFVRYYPAHKSYNHRDIYNMCLFRVAHRIENEGSPERILYDYPISWTDTYWAGCFHSHKTVNNAAWQEGAHTHLALHTRYPKNGDSCWDGGDCPLRRVLRLVDHVWSVCDHQGCIPNEGHFLADYEGVGKVRKKMAERKMA